MQLLGYEGVAEDPRIIHPRPQRTPTARSSAPQRTRGREEPEAGGMLCAEELAQEEDFCFFGGMSFQFHLHKIARWRLAGPAAALPASRVRTAAATCAQRDAGGTPFA